MSRSEKEKMFRRSLLAEKANSLFREKSYYSIKVEEITTAAEFSKGSFYRYFYNKDELVFEIYHSETVKLNAELNAILIADNFDTCLPMLSAALLSYYGSTAHLLFILDELLDKGNNDKADVADTDSFIADKLRLAWKEKITETVAQKNHLLHNIIVSLLKKENAGLSAGALVFYIDSLAKGISLGSPAITGDPPINSAEMAQAVSLLLKGIRSNNTTRDKK